MNRYRRVYVEISNLCNLQCSFCPEVERPDQVMSPEFFRKTLTEVAPLTDEVCLHLMGEPLGHSHFPEIVSICKELSVPVNVTTNGILLTGLKREAMLLPVVRQVNFSVHSFVSNFPSRDITPYMQRLFQFARDALLLRPDLYINFRLWDLTEPDSLTTENSTARDLIQQEFKIDLTALTIDLKRKKSFQLTGRTYLNLDSRFDWPNMKAPIRSETGTCHGLGSHFGIHADGSVVPCCLDKEAVITLGNMHDSSLAEILSSNRANAMRSGFKNNKLVEDLCRRCTFISRFDRKAKSQRSANFRPSHADREELPKNLAQ